MPLTNQSKPSTSLTNTAQPDRGITWATISTTWATETETWGEASQLFTNSTRPGTYLWTPELFPWLMLTPWIGTDSEITNIAKP